jgi:alpha-galactosidase/6-phospho-beta-glucosidase family protein
VPLPPLPAALLARHATYEMLALEAADAPEPVALERALLANPMVSNASQARRLTQAIIESGPAPAGVAPGVAP